MNISSTELLKKLDEKSITKKEIVSQANIYLTNNNFTAAYPYVKAAALSNQKSITDKLIAGVLAVSLQKNEDAHEMFMSVLAQDPHNYDAHYNLALIEVYNAKYVDAYKRLTALSEKNKKNSELQNDLAVIATYQNDSTKAFSHWKKALKLNPNDSVTRNNALTYSLEKNFFKEADQLLSQNKKSKKTDSKAQAEINRWQQIFDENKNEQLEKTEELLPNKELTKAN